MPRINVYIPDRALAMIDARAQECGLSRSEFLVQTALRASVDEHLGTLTDRQKREVASRISSFVRFDMD